MSTSKAGRPSRFHKAISSHLAELRENLFIEHDSDVQRLEEEVDLLKAKLANRSAGDLWSDASNELEDVPGGTASSTTEVESMDGCALPRVPRNTIDVKAAVQDHRNSGSDIGCSLELRQIESPPPLLHADSNGSEACLKITPVSTKSPKVSVIPAPTSSFKAMGWFGQASKQLGNRISNIRGSAKQSMIRQSNVTSMTRHSNVKPPARRSASPSPREGASSKLGTAQKKASVRKSGLDNSDSSNDSDDDVDPFSEGETEHGKLKAETGQEEAKDRVGFGESKDSDIIEFKVASTWLKYDGRKTRFGRVSALDQNAVENAVKAYKDNKPNQQLGAWREESQHNGQQALRRGNSAVKIMDSGQMSKRLQSLMIAPSSLKHILWELMGLVLIIFDAVNIPMEIFRPPETWLTSFSMWLPCFFWLLDILLNFCTGYLTPDGTRVMRFSHVACRYARTWLPFDFLLMISNWVAVLVNSTPTHDGFQGLQIWRVLTLLRVLNLVRLAKAPELEGFIAEHIRSEMTRLIAEIGRNIVVLLVTAHVIACAWYGLGRHIVDGGDTTSWVYMYDLERRDVWQRYTFSLHWSLALFAGENIAETVGLVERIFAIVIFVFAFLFSAIFVSSITTLMTRLQIIAGKQSSQLNALRRYLVDKCISTSLTVRILRNAKHSMQEQTRNAAEASIELLKGISEPLRVELHFEVYFPVLSFHPFLKNYNTINPAGMRKVCHTAVSVITLSTGDILFSEGETPERPRMLFVVSGQLMYYQEESQDVTELRRGTWLCEATLWTTWLHYCGTLRGVSESSLLAIDAVKFQRILRPFPTAHARSYGESFVKQMNEAARSSMTDLPDISVDYHVAKVFPEFHQAWEAQSSFGFTASQALSRNVSGPLNLKAKAGLPKSILPFVTFSS